MRAAPLNARATTKSGLTNGDGSGHPIFVSAHPCEWCGAQFTQDRPGERRFCSKSCGAKSQHAKRRGGPWERTCEQCGVTFPGGAQRRYCSKKCANTAIYHSGNRQSFTAGSKAENKRRTGAAQERAQRRAERWSSAKGVRTGPHVEAVREALGWPKNRIEWRVWDGTVYWLLDLADPTARLDVEIDGSNHRLKSKQVVDARKTAALESVGWSVLRFTNTEVERDLDAVVTKIREALSTT